VSSPRGIGTRPLLVSTGQVDFLRQREILHRSGVSADDSTDASSRARTLHIEATAALQHIGVPSWMVDRNGDFVWLNDAFVSMFGDRRGEHFSVVVAPEFRDLADDQFRRKLGGELVTDYEIEALLPDGGRVQSEISSARLDRSSLFVAVFGVAVGIHPVPAEAHTHLTPRQREVLELLAGGASTNQIAEAMSVTRETVRNYVRQVLRALNAHSRLEAVIKARQEGLFQD
jgi:PAS domain S-box-containing protein